MEDKKSYYTDIDLAIKKDLEMCAKEFQYCRPKSRIREISSRINGYLYARSSALYYARREKKNSTFAKQRSEWEQAEQLDIVRIRKFTSMLTAEEQVMYVDMIRSRFEDAMNEKDIKKKFKKYDFVIAACQLSNIDNEEIMTTINELKSNCKEIIEDIRTM